MSKFRHLMSIKENSEFKNNIDILNDLEDVFSFLSDDMDFEIETYFIEISKSEFGTERRKYDGQGDMVLKASDPNEYLYKSEYETWLVSGRGVVTSDKILKLCQEVNKSINFASKVLHLDNLLNKSTIGFYYEGSRAWKSFYFDDIEDDEEILNDIIEIKSNARVSISIQFAKI